MWSDFAESDAQSVHSNESASGTRGPSELRSEVVQGTAGMSSRLLDMLASYTQLLMPVGQYSAIPPDRSALKCSTDCKWLQRNLRKTDTGHQYQQSLLRNRQEKRLAYWRATQRERNHARVQLAKPLSKPTSRAHAPPNTYVEPSLLQAGSVHITFRLWIRIVKRIAGKHAHAVSSSCSCSSSSWAAVVPPSTRRYMPEQWATSLLQQVGLSQSAHS